MLILVPCLSYTAKSSIIPSFVSSIELHLSHVAQPHTSMRHICTQNRITLHRHPFPIHIKQRREPPPLALPISRYSERGTEAALSECRTPTASSLHFVGADPTAFPPHFAGAEHQRALSGIECAKHSIVRSAGDCRCSAVRTHSIQCLSWTSWRCIGSTYWDC